MKDKIYGIIVSNPSISEDEIIDNLKIQLMNDIHWALTELIKEGKIYEPHAGFFKAVLT